MTDREALIEFARGLVFAMGIVGVFVITVALMGKPEPTEKFTVVDTYKGCDVVRYTDRSNDWQYFLDCRKVRETLPPTP